MGRLIQTYIAKTLCQSVLMVVLVLLGVELFVLTVNEMSDIGQGTYTVWHAFYYISLQLPHQLYLLFPLACLIGSLLGLGALAQSSELTVMRASGVSIGQIFLAVCQTALLLITVVTVLCELFVPHLTHLSEHHKAMQTNAGQSIQSRTGVWAREGAHFIHIGKIQSKQHMQDIDDYLFDAEHRLQQATSAHDAWFSQGAWVLKNVAITHFTQQQITTEHYSRFDWPVKLKPKLLTIARNDPSEMSLWMLHHYIKSQKKNFIDVGAYQLSFWERLVRPLTTLVMMLLAVPFIFGSTRSTTMGARLVLGLGVACSFYMLNRFLGPVCLVYQIQPFIAAITPTLLFAGLGLLLLRKAR